GVWHVQRPGDELLASAAGDGPGWYAPGHFRQTASEIEGTLGGGYRAGDGMGDVPRLGLCPARDSRHPSLWREPAAGIRGAGRVAIPRAGVGASVPRPRRIIRGNRDRDPADAAA